MKKIIKTSLAAALGLCLALSDANADGIMQEPELWAGPYLGLSLGGGGGNYNTDLQESSTLQSMTTNNTAVITANTLTTTQGYARLEGSPTGGLANLFVGYNFHHVNSKLVYGAQVEGALYTTMRGNPNGIKVANVTFINFLTPANNKTTTNNDTLFDNTTIDSIFSALGRAGALVKPGTLVYGLAGPSAANFLLNQGEKWVIGITAGAGVEHKITEHWSILAEYRFSHFEFDTPTNSVDDNVSFNGPSMSHTLYTTNTTRSSEFNNNMGIFGVVYRI